MIVSLETSGDQTPITVHAMYPAGQFRVNFWDL